MKNGLPSGYDCCYHTTNHSYQKGRRAMKISRTSVHWKGPAMPEVQFEEDQQLTSFAGLLIFAQLFERLNLRDRLKECFDHLKINSIYGHGTVVMVLIVHLLLGYRKLQEMRYYSDDPMVKRVLALKQLPDVATVSRILSTTDKASVTNMRAMLRAGVSNRLVKIAPARITADFDGSVYGTSRKAQGTAVGYNKKKKGQRSYYPLFCTIAQTGQVFDVLHRPGNVHDSNGARSFIIACIVALREILPGVIIEVRMDSAFFSDEVVEALEAFNVLYTISVPFERFTELKSKVSERIFWHRADSETYYFQSRWKPKCWDKKRRFLFVRTREAIQRKEPLQLNMYEPHEYGFQFKVIISNHQMSARKIVALHNGRGAQEAIFAELKSHAHMDYVPSNRLAANQTFLLSAILAHNLNRELQMSASEPTRATTEQRQPWWSFFRLETLRNIIIQRAGRLVRPQGRLTLKMSATPSVQKEWLHYLQAAA
jgi:Transposase DDE domain group 1